MSIRRRWRWRGWNDEDFIRMLKLMHFGGRCWRTRGWRGRMVRMIRMWVMRGAGCCLVIEDLSMGFPNVLTLFVVDLGDAFQNDKCNATLRKDEERERENVRAFSSDECLREACVENLNEHVETWICRKSSQCWAESNHRKSSVSTRLDSNGRCDQSVNVADRKYDLNSEGMSPRYISRRKGFLSLWPTRGKEIIHQW